MTGIGVRRLELRYDGKNGDEIANVEVKIARAWSESRCWVR